MQRPGASWALGTGGDLPVVRPWHRILAGAFLIAVAATSRPPSAEATTDRKSKPVEVRLFGYDTSASEHKTIILRDPDSPLQIQSARTFHLSRYQREDLSSRLHGIRIPKGPIVSVRVRTKGVAAFKIGFLFYDSFNEYAGGFTGVTTDPPLDKMHWSGRANRAWPDFGVACVYVSAVRLASGRVWKADLNKVAALMVEQGCSAENRAGAMKRLKSLPKGALRL